MKECEECYSINNRSTPILNPRDCLENHLQYICGTCGRCICVNRTEKSGLQRWNFPFKTLDHKVCLNEKPLYQRERFKRYPNAEIRRLTSHEVDIYLKEQNETK